MTFEVGGKSVTKHVELFTWEKLDYVDKVKEAFDYIYHYCTPQDTILLENDLPDAFSH